MALSDSLIMLARAARQAQMAPAPARTLWATVVAAAPPVWVRLDIGPDELPRPVSANAVGEVQVGDKVRVEHRGMRLTIVGKPQHPEETS